MLFRPYALTLRNFKSFGNALVTIPLDFTKPTLIVGQNFDSAVDGQLDSNGAGKTTISDAMCYVLMDRIISGKSINSDELINNINKKDLYVCLDFESDNNTFYRVERYRRNKELGGNGVRILERVGGKQTDAFDSVLHDITPDSVSNANTKIESILGMGFEIFSRIIAFSASHKPFLFLTSSEQTEIMEEISGLSELSQKAEILKKHIKTNKEGLDRLEEINTTIKAQRNQILNQIVSAKSKVDGWDATHKQELGELRSHLSKLVEADVDYDEQIALLEFVQKTDTQIEGYQANKRELAVELRNLEAEAGRAEVWDRNWKVSLNNASEKADEFGTVIDSEFMLTTIANYEKAVALRREKVTELAAKQKESNTKQLFVDEKWKEMSHLSESTCPYCSQQFKDAKTKLEEIKQQISDTNAEIATIGEDLNSIKTCISETEIAIAWYNTDMGIFTDAASFITWQERHMAAVADVKKIKDEVNPYSADNTKTTNEINDIRKDIEKLDGMITKKTVKRGDAKASLHFTRLQDILAEQNRIETLKTDITKREALTNPLSSTVAELESMKLEPTKDDEIGLLTDELDHQQFLLKLLTKKDSFIRKVLLEKTLPFLNARLRGYLDKIGFLHRVTFQEDLTVKIAQFGTSIGFGNLSSGQKARINLALSFAFRDVLQSRHNGKLKFCILDECLDVGLGNVGVQLAAKMIKQVATEDKLSMFVISHRDEIAQMFDNRLVIQLKSGFSTILEE